MLLLDALGGLSVTQECPTSTSIYYYYYYQLVAKPKPLGSMGTAGSMDCERWAKPLKHTILTKVRNRMKDGTGILPFFEDMKTFIISCMRRRCCLGRGFLSRFGSVVARWSVSGGDFINF